MLAPALRAYMRMQPRHTGVLVTAVNATSSVAGVLHERDVLMSVAGRPVSNDGNTL